MDPKDWPRCPVCDEPALDGHITCGDVRCNEAEQRIQHRARPMEPRCPKCGDNRWDVGGGHGVCAGCGYAEVF